MWYNESIPISILNFQNEEAKNNAIEGAIVEYVMDLTREEVDTDPTK